MSTWDLIENVESKAEPTITLQNVDEEGPLSWLHHAGIAIDDDEDSITLFASVGDPRGSFAFTLRRHDNGQVTISTPYPGEGIPHEKTTELMPGRLLVIHDNGVPIDFSDEEGE